MYYLDIHHNWGCMIRSAYLDLTKLFKIIAEIYTDDKKHYPLINVIILTLFKFINLYSYLYIHTLHFSKPETPSKQANTKLFILISYHMFQKKVLISS